MQIPQLFHTKLDLKVKCKKTLRLQEVKEEAQELFKTKAKSSHIIIMEKPFW